LAVADKARLQDELGDVLFAVTNLARRLDIDPETALRGTNAKFDRRFRRIEALLADDGRTPDQSTLDEMETLWQRAKREETALGATDTRADEKKE
jgi:ATP diphosphatase